MEAALITATVPMALSAPFALWALLVWFLIGSLLRRAERPTDLLDPPGGFVVPSDAAALATLQVSPTLGWRSFGAAAIPGLLGWQRRDRAVMRIQAAFGWAALAALVALPGDARLRHQLPILAVYLISGWWAARVLAHPREPAERALARSHALDAAMDDAERGLPSCPRCRLRERHAEGWCPVCLAELAPHELPVGEAVVRVTSDSERRTDRALLDQCARELRISYNGGATILLRRPRDAEPSGPPEPAGPAGGLDGPVGTQGERPSAEAGTTVTIERAFADPARPELLWTRTAESVRLPGGRSYGARHIRAHGFVTGLLVQTWVFRRLGSAPPRPISRAA